MNKEARKFKIEADVPVPPKDRRGRPYYYPWREMKIGESTLLKADLKTDQGIKEITSARTSVSRFGKINGMRFKALLVDNGLRVWRMS